MITLHNSLHAYNIINCSDLISTNHVAQKHSSLKIIQMHLYSVFSLIYFLNILTAVLLHDLIMPCSKLCKGKGY